MTEIVVRTQNEFDAALNEPANHAIMIASEENMLLNVSGTVGKIVSARSGRLRVCGNARVESVCGRAQVILLCDDAYVGGVSDNAYVGGVSDNARVGGVSDNARIGDVFGNSKVGDVSGNAQVESVSDDATVESVSDNAKIRHVRDESTIMVVRGSVEIESVSDDAEVRHVHGNAKVRHVHDYAHVEDVFGNSKIEIVSGNATVESVSGNAQVGDVSGNAQVESVSDDAQVRHVHGNAKVMGVYDYAKIGSVYGYAMVSLYDYARVKHQLGAHAIAFVHSPDAMVSGANVIDMAGTESHDPEMWAAHTAADVLDGEVVLWKALGADLTSGEEFGRPVKWEVGQEVSCDDWNPTPECGGGLHLSPHPYEAIMHRKEAARMLKCSATMSDIVPIICNNDSDECRVKSVRVIDETNMDGTPLLASEEK